MASDIIKSIKQAEAEADQIVKQSVAEARQIVAEGREKSISLLKQYEAEAEEEARQIIQKAELSARKEADNIMEKVLAECEAIKEKAGSKSQEAIGKILERIVNINGNR